MRIPFYVASFVVLPFFFVVGFLVTPRSPAKAQPAPAVQRWQYATWVDGVATTGNTVVGSVETIDLGQGQPSIGAKSFDELFGKLGGKGTASIAQILTLLGRDGWELVQVTRDPGRITLTTYLLKRPAQQ